MDIAGWTYDAAAHRSVLAILGAVALGIVSGLGPCALARGSAIVSMDDRTSRRRILEIAAAYAGGASAGYIAYGAIAGLAFRAFAWSSASYAILTLVLFVTGVGSIVRVGHRDERAPVRSFGGAFLLGLGGSLAFSPCCTPFVFALSASAFGDARYAAALLGAFALGHVLPALGMASIVRVGQRLHSLRPDIVTFASGTISLAMAGYYGLLI